MPKGKKAGKKGAAAKKDEEKKLSAADVDALTDEQVLAELDALELEAEEGATPEALRAALKEALSEEDEEDEEEAEKPAAKAAKPAAKSESGEYRVHDAEGRFVRSYTPAAHGEEAGELASEFAAKIGGSVK